MDLGAARRRIKKWSIVIRPTAVPYHPWRVRRPLLIGGETRPPGLYLYDLTEEEIRIVEESTR